MSNLVFLYLYRNRDQEQNTVNGVYKTMYYVVVCAYKSMRLCVRLCLCVHLLYAVIQCVEIIHQSSQSILSSLIFAAMVSFVCIVLIYSVLVSLNAYLYVNLQCDDERGACQYSAASTTQYFLSQNPLLMGYKPRCSRAHVLDQHRQMAGLHWLYSTVSAKSGRQTKSHLKSPSMFININEKKKKKAFQHNIPHCNMSTRLPFTKIVHNPTKPELILANGHHFLVLNTR